MRYASCWAFSRALSVGGLCLFAALPLVAQTGKQDPVKWSLSVEPQQAAPSSTVIARLRAAIDDGWRLYAPTTGPGPIPTRVALQSHPAISSWKIYQPEPKRKFDPNFNSESQIFQNEAIFLLAVEVRREAAGDIEIAAEVRYQACNDTVCLRPVKKTATAKLRLTPGAASSAAKIPAGYGEIPALPVAAPSARGPAPPAAPTTVKQEGLGQFLALAFGFGLAAIFTPCVFPMIPITMSFFIGGGDVNRRGAAGQAAVFCAGIIVLFTALGLATTAALGPFGVVRIGPNPWVNGFIAAVFLAFGLSLLGAFEITLPSGLLTRLTAASQDGGLLATLVMGLTFALTSFACVGPFMGTLLAASVQGDRLQPALGMASFATGLASPFFLLALFPSYLKKLPRSGGWLARVKIVLGFIVLAAMLKYLSNVDVVLGWNVLTRERFLAAWVVLLAMPGLYLLGFLRMEGVDPAEKVGVIRALAGASFLALAVSLIPGMFGAPLGELDAYVPSAKVAARGVGGTAKLKFLKDDYAGAVAQARAENKLLFVNFTGYACTNCKWMKTNMFPRPAVAEALGGMVLVELHTDGTDAASEANRGLQEKRFQTVAIPHYVILDGQESVVASFVGLTKNSDEFVAFLNTARARPSG